MKLSTQFFLLAVFMSTICFAARGQLGYNYNNGGRFGPSNWGNLKPEWVACKNGTRQSPIDLANSAINSSLSGLQTNYTFAAAKLKNRINDIALEWPSGAGTLTFNGDEYTLRELHWHTPSEHTINDQRYDVEMQMVHQSSTGNFLIVGVLFRSTILRLDPLVFQLGVQIDLLGTTGKREIAVGFQHPPSVSSKSDYFLYDGSLTTPPCSETVTWVILHNVQGMSPLQINMLRSPLASNYRNNARPLQPLLGRNISYFMPY